MARIRWAAGARPGAGPGGADPSRARRAHWITARSDEAVAAQEDWVLLPPLCGRKDTR